MLRELMPTGATVALLSDPRNPNAAAEVREIEAAAVALGVRLLVLNASSPSELDAAFERVAQQDVGGLLNAADLFIIEQRDRIGPSFAGRETHHGAAAAAGDDGYCCGGSNKRPRREKPWRAAGASLDVLPDLLLGWEA